MYYQKIFFILTAVLFYKGQYTISGFLLAISLFSVFKEVYLISADKIINNFVKLLGNFLIKSVLSIIYIFVVLPTKIFSNKALINSKTSFNSNIDRSIDFKRSW